MKKQELRVVAGVIERGGLMLLGQRRAGDRFQFKWEFPGGKIEADEDPKEALARELREELDIEAQIGSELARYEHQYPGKKAILLIFLRVTSFTGTPVNRAFESIRWEQRENLLQYDFLDGDVDFVRRLAKGLYPVGDPRQD